LGPQRPQSNGEKEGPRQETQQTGSFIQWCFHNYLRKFEPLGPHSQPGTVITV